jgi:hypothetical protein
MSKSNSSTYWVDFFIRQVKVLDRHDCLGGECFVYLVEVDVVFGDSCFGEDCGDGECWADTASQWEQSEPGEQDGLGEGRGRGSVQQSREIDLGIYVEEGEIDV